MLPDVVRDALRLAALSSSTTPAAVSPQPNRLGARPAAVRAVLVLATAVALSLLPAHPARAAGGCTPSAEWGVSRAAFAAEVVKIANAYRASKGLGALAVSSSLTASATWKSLHMASGAYLAHDDPAPYARTAFARARDCGFTGTTLGENLAYGQTSAEEVVAAWIDSPDHRRNLESPEFTSIGAGAAEAGGSSTGRRTSATTRPRGRLPRPRRPRPNRRERQAPSPRLLLPSRSRRSPPPRRRRVRRPRAQARLPRRHPRRRHRRPRRPYPAPRRRRQASTCRQP
ncbi:MAG: CAP domain-containing protein, partial [Actinobacteria bacterium]|nr:CAP domain-containing protein [Actinomycetota bacterium]